MARSILQTTTTSQTTFTLNLTCLPAPSKQKLRRSEKVGSDAYHDIVRVCSQSTGQYHSVKGTVVETVGNLTGATSWQQSGKQEHAEGEGKQHVFTYALLEENVF